jgi:transglutaminase-like putative cysteine protease
MLSLLVTQISMRRYRCFAMLLLLAATAFQLFGQSNKISTGPPKSWVEAIHFNPQAMPAAGQESGYYYLLLDKQENTVQQEYFFHFAYKILTYEGLQQMSDLSFSFDPAYEQLIFHSITIHRNGTMIDQLPKTFRTIQREQSMDRFLYDGSLTTVVNLTDVRVGDIIEYSFTRKGYNPVYGPYFNREIYFNYSFPVEKIAQRLVTSTAVPLTFKYVNTDIKPVSKMEGNVIEYRWTVDRAEGLTSDNHEPAWYNSYAHVFISNFKNWQEVAAWAVKTFQLPDTETQKVTRTIVPEFKSTAPEAYALEVIRFVQDEIRYLGFESGLNSHQPHSPLSVYQQRFGDCKDKSLLLATLLQAKGIEAYPLLVNTVYQDKIAEQLPSATAFDHCVVQITLNNNTFYVDPTINNQGGTLTDLYFPYYGKGLVVNARSSDLTDLPPPGISSTSEVQTFDLAAVGGEGMLKVKTTYTGWEADMQRSYFARNNRENIQKNYLTYYGNLYPDIEKLESIEIKDDRHKNIFVVDEYYKIPQFWKNSSSQDDLLYCEFYGQSLEGYFNVGKFAQRKAPYRLSYPVNYTLEIQVNLPEEWSIERNSKKIETEYYSYDYNVHYANRTLRMFTNYQTKTSSIPVTAITQFMEDHQRMMNHLAYSLTYDQKYLQVKELKLPGTITSILAVFAGIALVLWLYTRYDPQPYYPAAWAQPIGGWLVLVAFGITLTPFRLLYDFITNTNLLSGEAWLVMFYMKNYTAGAILLLLHVYNLVFLLYAVLVVVLFYQRRSSVPRLISILYGISCLATILDAIVSHQIDPGTAISSKDIVRSVFTAAIWIPYFHLSTRVKKTFVFVHNGHNNSNPDNMVAEPVMVSEDYRNE